MEWQRVYYKMGIAISSVAQFEMELQRAKVLQHDLIKSYVRLPDLQQKRMVEFAHSIGVPVATHEIYPAALCRRRQHRAHVGDQPARLLAEDRDAAARLRGCGAAVRQEPAHPLSDDLRRRRAASCSRPSRSSRTIRASRCIPTGSSAQVAAQPAVGTPSPRSPIAAGGSGRMVMDIMRAGGADRRRHRHAERDQPARRADGVHARRDDARSMRSRRRR